eukprot:CAMPEP_0182872146 /NCGR_PEP_ID=MMETSP0034_2-20130328/11532_1 /TAXON_ID=156128 /ORGANISM="Nephroselmis pyriformis, Strain CCMP717" /LENGTH=171 /DNA_ID=CAMNT_0025004729 /DNA_START=21 /DNA_END=533 /DNA_ORIENTATION=-
MELQLLGGGGARPAAAAGPARLPGRRAEGRLNFSQAGGFTGGDVACLWGGKSTPTVRRAPEVRARVTDAPGLFPVKEPRGLRRPTRRPRESYYPPADKLERIVSTFTWLGPTEGGDLAVIPMRDMDRSDTVGVLFASFQHIGGVTASMFHKRHEAYVAGTPGAVAPVGVVL